MNIEYNHELFFQASALEKAYMKIVMETISKTADSIIPLSNIASVRKCEACDDASGIVFNVYDDRYVIDDALYTDTLHYHLTINDETIPIDYICCYLNYYLYLHKRRAYEYVNHLPMSQGKIAHDQNMNCIGFILCQSDNENGIADENANENANEINSYEYIDIYAFNNINNINIHLISVEKWDFIMKKNKQLGYFKNIYL